MPTHPHESEPFSPQPDPPVGNPTHLPVEPEFGQTIPPAEPEDPGQKPAPQ
jgi:hypothetical protein